MICKASRVAGRHEIFWAWIFNRMTRRSDSMARAVIVLPPGPEPSSSSSPQTSMTTTSGGVEGAGRIFFGVCFCLLQGLRSPQSGWSELFRCLLLPS